MIHAIIIAAAIWTAISFIVAVSVCLLLRNSKARHHTPGDLSNRDEGRIHNGGVL